MAVTAFDGQRWSDRTRRRLAWLVPLVVAGLVAAVLAVANASSSAAAPNLPARTPAQLIAAVEASSATAGFSGEVAETVHLGLPTLPGSTSTGSAPASLNLQSLLTGSHTARVWVDGQQRQRVAVLGQLSEADVTHNGRDLWTYTSATNTVTHASLPQPTDPGAAGPLSTPAALAAKVLAAVNPTTAVSVGAPRTVAGRAAYTLVVAPRDSRSTISAVTIAIDASTSVPLQVQIRAGGSSPALSVGFTSVSFSRPAASTFAFTVPHGAKVATRDHGSRDHGSGDHPHPYPGGGAPSDSGYQGGRPGPPAIAPTVIGSGWTTAVEVGGVDFLPPDEVSHLTTPVAGTSDRLLHTALINVILTPDGRTYVGALEPGALEQLAASRR